MPQAAPDMRARWPGGDGQAIGYLESRGFALNRNWTWTRPPALELDDKDRDAVAYLIDEWDFGGLTEEAS